MEHGCSASIPACGGRDTSEKNRKHKLEACATVAQTSLLACGVSILACGSRDTRLTTENTSWKHVLQFQYTFLPFYLQTYFNFTLYDFNRLSP